MAKKDKLIDCVVHHPKLYLSVKGKLERIEPGTELERTQAQIDRSRGKIVAKKTVRKLTVTAAENDLKAAQAALDAVKPKDDKK